MKIKRIEIKDGYKRFHHLIIDLGDSPARLVALVGPNGCGKSSVFDAMLHKTGNVLNSVGSQGGRDNDYHSMRGTPYDASQSIQIDFDKGPILEISRALQQAPQDNRFTLMSFRSCYRYNSRVKINRSESIPGIGFNNYGASADVDEKKWSRITGDC